MLIIRKDLRMRKKSINREKFAIRLSELMELNNETTYTMADTFSLSPATISRYTNGQMAAKITTIEAMAKHFSVNPAWLMGYDTTRTLQDTSPPSFDNIHPIEVKKFPLLGEIACGEPIFANEDRESYVLAGTNINADFCLKAAGDSMIGARILDGDIVFVKRQDIVDDGDIAAVIIDNEATLKRVYYERNKNRLTLQSENPKYRPFSYEGEELNHIKILGKAVAFQSDVI